MLNFQRDPKESVTLTFYTRSSISTLQRTTATASRRGQPYQGHVLLAHHPPLSNLSKRNLLFRRNHSKGARNWDLQMNSPKSLWELVVHWKTAINCLVLQAGTANRNLARQALWCIASCCRAWTFQVSTSGACCLIVSHAMPQQCQRKRQTTECPKTPWSSRKSGSMPFNRIGRGTFWPTVCTFLDLLWTQVATTQPE